jgi:hypothetical protein
MIFENNDRTYTVSCWCDPDRTCCLNCQESAAKTFAYNNVPRSKWPDWLQDKFTDITKESVAKEIAVYKSSPERTNSLLERILKELRNFPFS